MWRRPDGRSEEFDVRLFALDKDEFTVNADRLGAFGIDTRLDRRQLVESNQRRAWNNDASASVQSEVVPANRTGS